MSVELTFPYDMFVYIYGNDGRAAGITFSRYENEGISSGFPDINPRQIQPLVTQFKSIQPAIGTIIPKQVNVNFKTSTDIFKKAQLEDYFWAFSKLFNWERAYCNIGVTDFSSISNTQKEMQKVDEISVLIRNVEPATFFAALNSALKENSECLHPKLLDNLGFNEIETIPEILAGVEYFKTSKFAKIVYPRNIYI